MHDHMDNINREMKAVKKESRDAKNKIQSKNMKNTSDRHIRRFGTAKEESVNLKIG